MADAFQLRVPIGVWLDKSAPAGQQRRIGGIVSTESRDQEDEVVLQRGLDFSDFLKQGYYNDNHSKATSDVVGYPTAAKMISKGQQLPDGTTAPAAGWWAEGCLLEDHPPADKIWTLAQSLSKTEGSRRLGFSIEGKILKRSGSDHKVIAAAAVRNVAITNCPVNQDTGLAVLAKSLRSAAATQTTDEDDQSAIIARAVAKALSNKDVVRAFAAAQKALMAGGSSTGLGGAPGNGRAIIPQSLESDLKRPEKWHREKACKSDSAEEIVRSRFPSATDTDITRILETIRLLGQMKRR